MLNKQQPGYFARICKSNWKMRSFEARAGRHFARVIAVSSQDRDYFQQNYGWKHVDVIDTAVDVDYFQRDNDVEEIPDRIVFVGSMDWLPNQDGIRYFVENAWPIIRKARPQATFQVVGRNPTPSVLNLNDVPGVEVIGTVPDIRPYLDQASLVVVPLLVGGGTRLKIFEAMAMKKPVVSTPLGAEGLDVEPDNHLVLASLTDEFAREVVALLCDRPRRDRLAESAQKVVIDRYSAKQVANQFDGICRTGCENKSGQTDLPGN